MPEAGGEVRGTRGSDFGLRTSRPQAAPVGRDSVEPCCSGSWFVVRRLDFPISGPHLELGFRTSHFGFRISDSPPPQLFDAPRFQLDRRAGEWFSEVNHVPNESDSPAYELNPESKEVP
jgi:hypothetical protein